MGRHKDLWRPQPRSKTLSTRSVRKFGNSSELGAVVGVASKHEHSGDGRQSRRDRVFTSLAPCEEPFVHIGPSRFRPPSVCGGILEGTGTHRNGFVGGQHNQRKIIRPLTFNQIRLRKEDWGSTEFGNVRFTIPSNKTSRLNSIPSPHSGRCTKLPRL